ncbi:hypothetical protein METHB2_40101 [Candidatus Methylobacter favarea]|uniref:Transposase n=1 Tax=Candidatus Methylobacter favarea TaxID=2707345 RepID=A0A8S0WB49_9GAMM|nr:hypothetical protein METHB2_40101 [Candidatus Methylobacter favarea]
MDWLVERFKFYLAVLWRLKQTQEWVLAARRGAIEHAFALAKPLTAPLQ